MVTHNELNLAVGCSFCNFAVERANNGVHRGGLEAENRQGNRHRLNILNERPQCPGQDAFVIDNAHAIP